MKDIIKRKQTVLFCIDTLNGGGAEKLLIDILERLDPEKYEITLFVSYFYGVYFERIPNHVRWFAGEDFSNYEKEIYDVEVAFLEGLSVKYVANRPSEAKKIAWIHTDLYNFHWSAQFYESPEEECWCFNQMDRVVCVSEYAALCFSKKFPGLNTSLEVIWNLVDREAIRKKSTQFNPVKNKFTMCTVGRLVYEKRLDLLIKACSLLKKERLDFETWIIGTGYLKEDLTALVAALGLEETVLFKEFQANPYPCLKAADLFVSTSLVEGFSLVIAEAICLNRPVVATITCGSLELLDAGQYGLVVDHDEKSIYKAIRKVMKKEKLRKRLEGLSEGRSAFFDTREVMDQIEKLLERTDHLSL